MRRIASGHPGFTLVELIAVIVVTAILASVTLPALSNLASIRAGAGARALAQQLAFVREHAVNLGNRSWVSIDVDAETMSSSAEPDGGTGLGSALALTDPVTGRAMLLDFTEGEFRGTDIERVDFGGGASLGFDWLGSPLDEAGQPLASDGEIVIAGGLTVWVRARTGDIRVENP